MQQQQRTLAEQERLAREQRLALQQQTQSKVGGYKLSTPLGQIELGEKIRGAKTDYPLKHFDSWSWQQAYHHWLYGEGQPVKVAFRSLHFNDGYFQPESEVEQIASHLLDEARFKNHIVFKEVDLKNQRFEFNPSNISDYATYGDIRIDVKGTILADPNGNWQFDGKLYPGFGYFLNGKPLRGDIFDFNPDHRFLPAEVATRVIHNLPGTSYRIYFKEEYVQVILRYRNPIEGQHK